MRATPFTRKITITIRGMSNALDIRYSPRHKTCVCGCAPRFYPRQHRPTVSIIDARSAWCTAPQPVYCSSSLTEPIALCFPNMVIVPPYAAAYLLCLLGASIHSASEYKHASSAISSLDSESGRGAYKVQAQQLDGAHRLVHPGRSHHCCAHSLRVHFVMLLYHVINMFLAVHLYVSSPSC